MDQWLKFGKLPKRKNDQRDDSDSDEHDIPSCSKAKKTLMCKTRKYSAEYLSLGFTFTLIENVEQPLCVICHSHLSNESMKPAKLRRHLESKHKDYVNKPVEYFKMKLHELQASQKLIKKTVTGSNNEQAVHASFQVSLLVAKSGKPHTIAENLILPAAKAIVSTMIGSKAAQDLNLISLSNDTVKNRISEMSQNIKDQLIERVLKSQFYSLQLDETTDIASNPNLLSFIRYEFSGKIYEDFLFCKLLPTRTTGAEIFRCLNNFITNNKMEWSKCIGMSTDGARAMSGTIKGLMNFVKTVAPNVVWTHCCIHREALAAKKMPDILKTTLNEIVSVVNFIKARPLNSRLFQVLCEEMGSQHKHLLLHAEVRWLSRGKVLNRIFELRDEVRLFLMENDNFYLKDRFFDFSWLAKVGYLADIHSYLNELNLSLQGTSINIFKVEDKIKAIIKKMDLWISRLTKGIIESFPTLHEFVESSDNKLSVEEIQILIEHIKMLKESFRNYFPSTTSDHEWVRDPFCCKNIEVQNLTISEQDELAELSCDSSYRLVFNEHTVEEFWLKVKNVYPTLAEKAIKYLLPFCTTYLCERAFSMLLYMKNKYRNRLDVEPELRINISNIDPNIAILVSQKQHHPSHGKN